MASEDDVRRIACSLPGAFERSFGGQPSWRTEPRMFAWIRTGPDALVVWVESVEEKEALLAAEPTKFFTTPHYDGHAIVLVRLDAVGEAEARELITESWLVRAPRSLTRGFEPPAGSV